MMQRMNLTKFSISIAQVRVLCVLGICLLGCDNTPELVKQSTHGEAAEVLVGAHVSAKSVLLQCAQAYKPLTSYEDHGVVRLRYRIDGEPMVDEAPLSIAWDRHGRIGLRVYSVQAGPDAERWRLRITEPSSDIPAETSDSLERQVISRSVPEQVSFDWLLSDPLIAEQLAAGLAGFPPQLDLLLSPEPLSGLVGENTTMRLGAPELVENEMCHVVNVDRGGEYCLWIEQASGLLRRVKLPNANLSPEIQQDRRVSQLELTIELQGVQVNQPVDWERFAVMTRPGDLMVNHFVPTPVMIDTTGLGVKIPAFFLNDPVTGEVAYSSVDSTSRSATVLIWLADHPSCRQAVEQLQRVKQSLTTAGVLGKVEFVSVWAEPTPPTGLSFGALGNAWSLPGILTVDREALGRDLFHIHEAPTLIVLDRKNRVQLRDERANPLLDQFLPQLLLQLVNGEDLTEKLLERNENVAKRHVADVAMAAALDAAPTTLPNDYGANVVKMTAVARVSHRVPIVAADVDDQQRMWVLLENGQLEAMDGAGIPEQKLQTLWGGLPGKLVMQVAPESEFVALLSNQGESLQVFNTRTNQNTLMNLGSQSKVVDMQWVLLQGSKSPRLAVIDNHSQTVLFDPTNREQLSGECPSAPVAIIGFDGLGASVGGLVVLADRSVEPLELSDESTLKRPIGWPAAFATSSEITTPRKLSFSPAHGPWTSWAAAADRRVLARGWLAKDEPALFLLDNDLNPLWHYRMPLSTESGTTLRAVAKDPSSGQAVWAVCEHERTVHLLRNDGASDHFRVERPLVGLALLPSGTRLILTMVHPDELVRYEIHW